MKRTRWFLLLLSALLLPTIARAEPDNFDVGDGSSGNATRGDGPINEYAQPTGSIVANGTPSIDLITATIGHHNPSNGNFVAGSFANGDLIMVWQPTYTASVTSGDQSPVTLSGSHGLWEFARVQGDPDTSVPGITTLPLHAAMVNAFDATAQVIKVPQFNSLTIQNGKTIFPDPWDPTTHLGGIVVFLCKNTVTFQPNAGISADAAGSPGGGFIAQSGGSCPGNNSDPDLASPFGAKKGRGAVENANHDGAGNVANGGGGGNCALAGGGGGGNLGQGGNGGASNSGVAGSGGASLSFSMFSRLAMGGGGGAGQGTTGTGGSGGGNGGGAIFFRADAVVDDNANPASITANGASGPDSSGGTGGGAGGGGAGGSIYIRLVEGNGLTCANVQAKGGKGGNSSEPTAGPGGGGASGRVFFQASAACSGVIDPGQAGDVPVGADAGMAGATAGGTAALSPAPPGGGFCFASTDPPCSNSTLVCDLSINGCVQCLADADCKLPVVGPTLGQCDLNNASGSFQQCISCGTNDNSGDAHCAHLTATPACSSSGSCVECTANHPNLCSDGTPVCSDPSGGTCVECNGDPDCSSPTAPRCSSHSCATCTSDSNCNRAPFTSTTPACGPLGTCVECSAGVPTLCDDAGKVCRITPGECVSCLDATQCTVDAPVCNNGGGSPTFTCVGCSNTNNSECSSYAGANRAACDVTAGANLGKCEQCSATLACSSPPNCDLVTGQCVECESQNNAECADPAKPQCNGNDSCDVCTSNSGCTGHGILTHCDSPGSGQCFQCLNNTHCATPTQPECSSHLCQACTPTGDGSPAAGCVGHAGVFCEAASGKCVQCLKNADCTNPSFPACDTNAANTGTFHTCVACTNAGGDSGCTGHVGTLACQPNGTCGQCSLTNTVACDGSGTPACNFQTGNCQLCTVNGGGTDMGANASACAAVAAGHACESGAANTVFCGCGVDSDCGTSTSGRICDLLVHTCTNGCSRALNHNNCPLGQFCTANPNGSDTGVCTLECNFDIDCTAGGMTTAPFCIGKDPDGGVGHCVECRDGSDCTVAGKLVCNPTSNACVECTPTQMGACSTSGTGAACLNNGQCGCTADTDCGGPQSGRVCDGVTHACAAGCRGLSGNGCPTTLMCTSSTSAIGSCVNIPDMAALPDMSVAVDLAVPGPPDLSVGDLGELDAATRLDGAPMPSNETLAGGGFGCSSGGAPRPASGGAVLLCLLLGVGLAARRIYRRETRR